MSEQLFDLHDAVHAIDKELSWRFENPDYALHAEYRKGFTNGLIQAKYLIGEMLALTFSNASGLDLIGRDACVACGGAQTIGPALCYKCGGTGKEDA